MATIGLRDLYRAPITIGTSGAEEYGTPVRMAKAISAELSVEVAEAILYADDGADEVVKEFVSGEITLNVNDLLPADLAALLGQKQDTDKVVYGSDSDEAPYTAIGFRAKKAGGTYKYISRIEIGTRFVSDFELKIFAEVLGVSVNWLLGIDE